MRFEFDQRKSRQNLAKHGIDFETAQNIFEDPYAVSQRDETHEEEERWITLGEIAPGVVLFVVHTAFPAPDGDEVIRLISARAATSREKRQYEEVHKRAEAPNFNNRRKKGRRH
jgi:uncharacterized DUF497 family protein